MMISADLANTYSETARVLRAAAEETRQALQISRDLVERSRQQTRAMIQSDRDPALGAEQPGPSKSLVDCLIQAYELAEDDEDAHTRALLGRVLMHVGRRIASKLNPSEANIIIH